MKVINTTLRVLTFVFSLAALVLFFTSFATIVSEGTAITLSGAQLGFGGSTQNGLGETVKMSKSADILFCMLLTALATVFGGITLKSKRTKFIGPALALVAGVYLLVISLSSPWLYVDTRPLTNLSAAFYAYNVIITAFVLLASVAAGVAFILVNDYLETRASKDKLTIPQRVVRFFREYKSEVKKIVWPNLRSVIKNTVVVLILCLIVGAFIWLLDFGLLSLVDWLI